jgi:hypothetical protein
VATQDLRDVRDPPPTRHEADAGRVGEVAGYWLSEPASRSPASRGEAGAGLGSPTGAGGIGPGGRRWTPCHARQTLLLSGMTGGPGRFIASAPESSLSPHYGCLAVLPAATFSPA